MILDCNMFCVRSEFQQFSNGNGRKIVLMNRNAKICKRVRHMKYATDFLDNILDWDCVP